MATQYFCTPPNPQLDKYWDTVADRLFKIRNCMNIQGIVRQLALFDPPIDPGLLVRAAAAGVDLGSVIASLNAPPPHYRFRFLLARAVRLAEEIRSFGAMTLQVLERRTPRGWPRCAPRTRSLLLDAVRDIRKKQVRQVEEALAELSLEREHIDMQIAASHHAAAAADEPAGGGAAEIALGGAGASPGVAEGIDLVAKVMHAIPEFQTGAAGGFSSPFVTLQLGGQMFGDIAERVRVQPREGHGQERDRGRPGRGSRPNTSAAARSGSTSSSCWPRRRRRSRSASPRRSSSWRSRRPSCAATISRWRTRARCRRYLRDKYTNEQLYGWMLGQLSGVYFQAYKVAFDAAQQAERAFRFERGDASSSFIEFSYWDSLKKGLFAGERLLLDLRRMESGLRRGRPARARDHAAHLAARGLPAGVHGAAGDGPLPDRGHRSAARRRFPGPLLPPAQDREPDGLGRAASRTATSTAR